MAIEICIGAVELRKALAEIERAEKNGFHHCLGIFRQTHTGSMLSDCRFEYSDLYERGSETDPCYEWGRFQRVTERYTFQNGKLCPPKPQKKTPNKKSTAARKKTSPRK